MAINLVDGTAAEIASRSPRRRALYISTTAAVMLNYGLVNAAAMTGLPFGPTQGPLLVSGKMAADRWTAYSAAGAPTVGVLEIYDVWP